MASEFLFVEEVASETRVSISTVRHWIRTGKLPSLKPGRRRLVRRSDLDALLAGAGSATVAGTPTANPHGPTANEQCAPRPGADDTVSSGGIPAPTKGER